MIATLLIVAAAVATPAHSLTAAEHHRRGLDALGKHRLRDAELEIRRAIEADPCTSLYHANLATVHLRANRVGAAIDAGKRGTELPGCPRTRNGREIGESAAVVDGVPHPDAHAHAHAMLGNAYLLTGRLKDAIVEGERAVAASAPGEPRRSALETLGNMHEWDNDLDAALRVYQRAVGQMGGGKRSTSSTSLCKFVDLSTRVCEWGDGYAGRLREVIGIARRGDRAAADCVGVWQSLFFPLSGGDVKRIAEAHANKLVEEETAGRVPPPPPPPPSPPPLPTTPTRVPANRKGSGTKMRVFYLGGEWDGAGPIGRTLRGIFACHDRSRFEIHVVSLGRPRVDTDDYREVSRHADVFHDASGQSFDAIARTIHGADVVVDTGHWLKSQTLRILARRPATLAVSIPAAPGTTGMPRWALDLITTDRFASPPPLARTEHTEALLLFDPPSGSHFMANNHMQQFRKARAEVGQEQQVDAEQDPINTDDRRSEAALPSRAEIVRREDLPARWAAPAGSGSEAGSPIILACFSTLYKVDPILLSVWASILAAVPNAVLWLTRGPSEAEPRLRRELSRRGVAPERVVFSDRVPRERHLERLRLAHIALDTPSYTGHSTTMDTLFAGVPAVTVAGAKMATRTAESVIRALGKTSGGKDNGGGDGDGGVVGGMTDIAELLVARSIRGYVHRVVRLATDHALRSRVAAAIRVGVREGKLFDTCAWVREFERGLQAATEVKRAWGKIGHIVL